MIARLGVLISVWCGLAAAQALSITGTVTSTLDSSPIARAKVTINGGPSTQAVLTDANGSFTFGGISPGTYSLIADRVGFLTPEGQGQQGQPAAYFSINVEIEKKPEAVSLHLTPSASVTGAVTEENGLPVPFPSITLIRRAVSEGRGQLTSGGGTSGNEIGEFRVAGLAPGSYLACLDATGSSYQRHHRLTNPMTCFPNVTDPSSAQWVNLRPGEERELNFQITPTHAIQVSGSVDTGGKTVYLSIKRIDPVGFPQIQNVPVDWDEKTATFRILALVPGDYLLTAHTSDGGDGPGLRGMRIIHAGTDDIRDLRLTLREGPYLSGIVRMEGAPTGPDDRVSAQTNGENVISIFAQSNGKFRLDNLDPGEYSTTVLPPGGWVVKSVTQGGADVRDSKIVLGTDVSPEPIEIVLAQATGGTIEVSFAGDSAAASAMVNIALLRHSETGDRWVAQGPSTAASTQQTFNLNLVPAGDYVLFAWLPSTEIEYLNPEVLQKYESSGQSVSVREGETSRVSVKAIAVKPAGN